MKLSIITATLNVRDLLRVSLRVPRCVNGCEIERIFVDGGSTDGTGELIESSLGPKDKFIYGSDDGIWDAFQKGLNVASGEFVAFLNAGDFYDERGFGCAVLAFDSCDVVQGFVRDVRADGVEVRVRRPDFEMFWLWNSRMCHPATFIRRQLYLDLGGFDRKWRRSADLDFYFRLAEMKPRVHRLPIVVTNMVVGGFSQRGRLNLENFQIVSMYKGFMHAFLCFSIQMLGNCRKWLKVNL